MSMKPPKKKKKKNPYRLSSDRQSAIEKANKGKKKKSLKDLLDKLKGPPKKGPKRKMSAGASKLKGNINKREIFKLKPGQTVYDKEGNKVIKLKPGQGLYNSNGDRIL